MKIKFLFLITSLFTVSLGLTVASNLEKYLDKFKNRYSLGKEVTSYDDFPYLYPNPNMIDTTFLLRYTLVNTRFGVGSPHYEDIRFRHLDGYQCEHIGHYKIKSGFLLFSKSMQCSAGSGNPVLTLSSVDNAGKLIDFTRFDWEFEQDEGLEEKTSFSISADFKIKHNQIRIDYKLENGKRVILKTTTLSTNYSLTGDGHFKLIEKK